MINYVLIVRAAGRLSFCEATVTKLDSTLPMRL